MNKFVFFLVDGGLFKVILNLSMFCDFDFVKVNFLDLYI